MRCTALRVRCRYAKFVSQTISAAARLVVPSIFVFYRGLSVHDASVLVTRASDHNPLLVEFSPGKPD